MQIQSRIQVRQIRADEWERLRELRLAALQDAPFAFGEQHAQAVQLPPSDWQARAERGAQLQSPVLVAVADAGAGANVDADGEVGAGDEWLGTLRLGILEAPEEDEPLPEQVDAFPVAEIMGVFVRPEHRGRRVGADSAGRTAGADGADVGVAASLLAYALDWAVDRFGAVWAVLDVTEANDRALAFYQRSGFADSGLRLPGARPGDREIRMVRRIGPR
jgi:ribosomal protein S18 acetylase RimI-like enzyme